MSRFVLLALMVLIGVLIASSSLILRYRMREIGIQQFAQPWRMLRTAAVSPPIWLCLLLGLTSFSLYAYVLSRAQVTAAAPATAAIGYFIVFVVSAIWLGDRVTASRISGAALLLIAIWLLTREGL